MSLLTPLVAEATEVPGMLVVPTVACASLPMNDSEPGRIWPGVRLSDSRAGVMPRKLLNSVRSALFRSIENDVCEVPLVSRAVCTRPVPVVVPAVRPEATLIVVPLTADVTCHQPLLPVLAFAAMRNHCPATTLENGEPAPVTTTDVVVVVTVPVVTPLVPAAAHVPCSALASSESN